jgi:hypothetical protein
MPEASPAADGDGRDAYAHVRGRGSADYLLRNAQQQLVELAGQSDVKANMIITICALLTSLLATRVLDDQLKYAAITLMSFLFVALVFAILAVMPKVPLGRQQLPLAGRRINPLFFAHAAHLPRDEYLDAMADVLADDASVYRAIVGDLHAQSTYLVRKKYRLLAVAYAAFLSGFVIAGTVLVLTLALD